MEGVPDPLTQRIDILLNDPADSSNVQMPYTLRVRVDVLV